MGRAQLRVTMLLAGGAVVAAVLATRDSELLDALCREDGPFEYLTAILYLVACGLFVIAGLQRPMRPLWYWGYAVLFFLIAGEEISWGQRIFEVATPEGLNRVNVQGELNLHNLDGVHQNIRAVACGVLLGICFVVPILDRFGARSVSVSFKRLGMPVFPLWASGIVTLALLLMVVPRLLGQVYFDLDEVGELYLSAAFFAFAVHVAPRSSLPVGPGLNRESVPTSRVVDRGRRFVPSRSS